MLLRKTYGIDLGSSSIKVYSFLRNKTYIEKNMIASRGRRIIAVAMKHTKCRKKRRQISCQFADGFWHDSQSGTSGDHSLQHDEENRPFSRNRVGHVLFCSAGHDSRRKKSVLSCGKRELAASEPRIYGGGTHCGCPWPWGSTRKKTRGPCW